MNKGQWWTPIVMSSGTANISSSVRGCYLQVRNAGTTAGGDSFKGLGLEQPTEGVVTAGAVVRTEDLCRRRILPNDRRKTTDPCYEGNVVFSRHSWNGEVGFDLDNGKSPRDAPDSEGDSKQLATR